MPVNIPIPAPSPAGGSVSNPVAGTIWVSNGIMMLYTGALWVPVVSVQEEDEMAEFVVTHKAWNVNSKRLLQQFSQLMNEIANDFIVLHSTKIYQTYNYSQIPEFLEAYCEDLVGENVITTYDVLGDHRNNPDEDVERGVIKVQVRFVQFNCLNVTTIDFTIRKK